MNIPLYPTSTANSGAGLPGGLAHGWGRQALVTQGGFWLPAASKSLQAKQLLNSQQKASTQAEEEFCGTIPKIFTLQLLISA